MDAVEQGGIWQSGGRGRPSKRGEGEITQTILTVAARLFLELGYEATSMKNVSKEAGVAPNTLYLRYRDKADLFTAVVKWKATLWGESNPPMRIRSTANIQEIIERGMLNMLLAGMREDVRGFGQLLQSEARKFPELAIIYRDRVMALGVKEFAQILVECPTASITEARAMEIVLTMRECAAGYTQFSVFDTSCHHPDIIKLNAKRIAGVIAGSL